MPNSSLPGIAPCLAAPAEFAGAVDASGKLEGCELVLQAVRTTSNKMLKTNKLARRNEDP
jgi:hypothetical protein